jgi:hypothetical protein
MQVHVLYEDPHAATESRLCGEPTCACMSNPLESLWEGSSSRLSAKMPIASRFVALRLSWLRRRAAKCPTSHEGCTFPKDMSARSSKNSTHRDGTRWFPSTVEADRRSSVKNRSVSLWRRHCVRPTFWAGPFDAGRSRSCGIIFVKSESWTPSAWRRFATFLRGTRFGCNEPRRGKNATIPSFGLKKTDPAVREAAGPQWSDDFLRRVRAVGDTPASRAIVSSGGQAHTLARDVYAKARCATLAGLLRRAFRSAVGVHAAAEAFARSAGRAETNAATVSAQAADSSDPGQLLSARHAAGATVVPEEQHSFDLDADKRLMAQSYRITVHAGQGIRDSQFQLYRPRRNAAGLESLCDVSKQLCETKVIEPFWKRH